MKKILAILLFLLVIPSVCFGATLLGVSSATDDGAISINSYRASRFLCTTTGTLTSIMAYSGVSTGSAVAAIYSDDAPNNRPLNLLSGDPGSATTITATGWQTISIGNQVNVTAGTYYWLVLNTPTANLGRYGNSAGAKVAYNNAAWGNFPAGSSFTAGSDYVIQLRGVGTISSNALFFNQ